MRRFFSHATAKAVGAFVNKKVFLLQKEYTKRDGGTPYARATMARLRRDLDGSTPSWMVIGEDVFTDWPAELPSPEEDPAVLRAVKTSLELYALHQQSRSQGVAQSAESDRAKRMTFGRACRLIQSDPGRDSGVRRRLASVEAAPDFDGAVRNIRALILLMRGAGDGTIVLDYYSLAQDLYQIQFPDARTEVFERWSMDYHVKPATTR